MFGILFLGQILLKIGLDFYQKSKFQVVKQKNWGNK